ncbi:uncharacterized protein METZ01_LOCUS225943, partial [marine metagenome]
DNIPLSRARRSRGQLVQLAQSRLKDRGHDPGGIDGVFGRRTKAAVKSFQRSLGLLRPSGAIDGSTWDALFLL